MCHFREVPSVQGCPHRDVPMCIYSLQDIGSRMKEKFRTKDEYWFNESAKKAEEMLSEEARVKYDRVKEQVSAMHTIIASMLEVRGWREV